MHDRNLFFKSRNDGRKRDVEWKPTYEQPVESQETVGADVNTSHRPQHVCVVVVTDNRNRI